MNDEFGDYANFALQPEKTTTEKREYRKRKNKNSQVNIYKCYAFLLMADSMNVKCALHMEIFCFRNEMLMHVLNVVFRPRKNDYIFEMQSVIRRLGRWRWRWLAVALARLYI